ncbi:hypothetical protein SAMN02745148_03044 [Modicisalibacter ilicicola DSM 19980]|uniref:Uncharacterized protein n=1 Tax=Modicisalibacter ilicicola DSM 19980 TaxID=1121942 RepID=A0A1M5CW27_9GAMM|nr:hypothetical protein [Halomonas ilicicola]SHF58913.1 hypothetical protein SAMN02745148_03044 [Halomonas ilicicola DSM 19980]
MKKQLVLTTVTLAAALSFGALLPLATPATAQSADQQPIYGSQLMTDQERQAYRNQMRSAQSAEERARMRAEHHERMQARAQEQGITLPDEPPARGMGQGKGMQQGQGMGQGKGMQQGQGMGQGKGKGMGSGNQGQ